MPDLLTASSSDVLLTPDGCVRGIASWAQEPGPCCLPPQCINPCDTACDLIELLPQGPMWNRQKAQAIEWLTSFNRAPWDLCRPIVECDPPPCPSLAQFAIFLSQYVATMIDSTIWSSVRESNPFTAVTSLDEWKERLGYQDCFRGRCRPNFSQTPSVFEVDGLYCPPELPDDMWCALDHAIVKAMTRMQVDGIHNLCYLNWIIEPFGARIEPHCECEPGLDGPCIEEDCCDIQFKVCPSTCTLDPCPPLHCYDHQTPDPIPACVNWECVKPVGENVPDIIWPGVILAVCFLRSYLPECPSIIYDCPDSELPDDCECLVLTEQPESDDNPLPGCSPRVRRINNLCGTP